MTQELVISRYLNLETCFKPAPPKVLSHVWDNYQPPADWIHQLALLTTQHASLPCSYHYIKAKLTSLIGSYRHNEFKIVLSNIYAVFSQQIKDPAILFNRQTDATILADKLVEGSENCGQGFHTRINSIWYSWLPSKTLPERLQKIRQEIVQRAARYYDDVHAQNTVSVIAAKSRFGVKSVNSKDFYGRGLNILQITANLNKEFNTHYTPLRIVQQLEEQLHDELVHLGYLGKPIDLEKKPEGITSGDYDKFIELFMNTFPYNPEAASPGYDINAEGQSSFVIPYWFICDEESYAIIDINWSAVRQAIYKQLQVEHIFINLEAYDAIKNIPFEHHQPLEFNYWLNQLANEAQFLALVDTSRSPEEQHNTLYQIHCALKKDHVYREHFNARISTLVNQHEDFISANLSYFFEKKTTRNDSLLAWNILLITKISAVDRKLDALETLFLRLLNTQSKLQQTLFTHFQPQDKPIIAALFNRRPSAIWNLVQKKVKKSSPLVEFILDICIEDAEINPPEWLTLQNQMTKQDFITLTTSAPKLALKYAKLCLLQNKRSNYPIEVPLLAEFFFLTADNPAPVLLEHFFNLPNDKLTALLKIKDNQGFNALMHLSHRQSASFIPMLKKLEPISSNPDILHTLFDAVDHGHNNLLLQTIISNPNDVPQLYAIIRELPMESQIQLLTTKTAINRSRDFLNGGENALFSAVMRDQEVTTKQLLTLMGTFDIQTQTLLLLTKNARQQNILDIALTKPSIFEQLLDRFNTLPSISKIHVLTQGESICNRCCNSNDCNEWVNKTGDNLLFRVMTRSSINTVNNLLQTINSLELRHQSLIYLAENTKGENILTHLLKTQNPYLQNVLDTIAKLNNTAEEKILDKIFLQTKQNKNSDNLLMLVIQHQPSQLESVLLIMKKLDAQTQMTLLTQTLSMKFISASNRNSLLQHLAQLPTQEPVDLKAPLRRFKLTQLETPEQIMQLLTLRQQHPLTVEDYHLGYFERRQLNKQLTNKDWYDTVTQKLLPNHYTKHQKEAVYQYITTELPEPKKQQALAEALDPNSALGKFFRTRRGILKCNEQTGTLGQMRQYLENPQRARNEQEFKPLLFKTTTAVGAAGIVALGLGITLLLTIAFPPLGLALASLGLTTLAILALAAIGSTIHHFIKRQRHAEAVAISTHTTSSTDACSYSGPLATFVQSNGSEGGLAPHVISESSFEACETPPSTQPDTTPKQVEVEAKTETETETETEGVNRASLFNTTFFSADAAEQSAGNVTRPLDCLGKPDLPLA